MYLPIWRPLPLILRPPVTVLMPLHLFGGTVTVVSPLWALSSIQCVDGDSPHLANRRWGRVPTIPSGGYGPGNRYNNNTNLFHAIIGTYNILVHSI